MVTFLDDKLIRYSSFLLLTLSMAFSNISAAAVQKLDRIAVVVNDDIIMETQVRKRLSEILANIKKQGVEAPPEDLMLRQVVEQLILESIQLQLGERAGVRIDDDTLNATMARLAGQNNMGLSEFQAALAAEGVSYQQMREQIRKELISTRVREGRVGSRIQITEQEVLNYLNSEEGKFNLQAEYRLGHLLIKVPESASAQEKANYLQRIERIRETLTAGASFEEVARLNSDGPEAQAGGDMGWRKASQLPSIFNEAAQNLHPEEVSEPITSANGFHLVKLNAKRGGDSVMVPQTKVRHILIKPTEIRTSERAAQLIQELRSKILAGDDFATIATDNSDDTGSLAGGGDLGWMTSGDLVPAFAKVMEQSEPNVVSEAFESPFGWHILEVLERREQDMGREVQRRRAQEVIYQRKFEEELEIWLQEEREDAYVDIKLY